MSDVVFIVVDCASCGVYMPCVNPSRCPSIRVNGSREAICEVCFARWNKIHRTENGLEPIPLNPDAYKPLDEGEMKNE